jgi:CTP:molybdopterin cytidylyltransferase MocA
MRGLIMAQGNQERMGTSITYPKQLLPIGSETIIGRTVRLLRSLGVADIVVVARHVPTWTQFAAMHKVELQTLPETGTGAAAGIWRSRHLWTDPDLAVLLGDVVFSRAVLSSVVAGEGLDFHIWSRGRDQNPVTLRSAPEVFALRLSGDGKERYCSFAASCEANGTLYTLHLVQETLGGGRRIRVIDYTDDLDTPEDIDTLPRLNAAVAAEEETWR